MHPMEKLTSTTLARTINCTLPVYMHHALELVDNTTVWTFESRYRIWNDYTVPLTVISTDPHTEAVNVASNKIINIRFRNPIKAGYGLQ